MKTGQTRANRPAFFQEYIVKAERALSEANKDNDFIYHERIPDPKTLSPIPKAALAKPIPLPLHMSANFKGACNKISFSCYYIPNQLITNTI